MIIGGMNHPARDVLGEVAWMAELGLGFIDFTMEPPAAAADRIDAPGLRAELDRRAMRCVGHTAYYAPIASALGTVRDAAANELARCLPLFAQLGARWVNVHPDAHTPFHERPFLIEQNLKSLRTLVEAGREAGVGVMIENMPGHFNTAAEMAELLDPLPELGMLLDIGHCNLLTNHNTAPELIDRFADRIRHVHLHDNKGGAPDLHLPLGTGTVPYRDALKRLKRAGYDGTLTLEVFSPDKRHFAFSRDAALEAWAAA